VASLWVLREGVEFLPVMRKLIYSMGVSLDGFIAGPAGEID